MALREAESRWPDVAYRSDAPGDYARALEPVLDVLAELSPTVEWSAEPAGAAAAVRHAPTARYAIFLDGTGLASLYGSEERLARLIVREVAERTGHLARVGIADGRYAALLGATVGAPQGLSHERRGPSLRASPCRSPTASPPTPVQPTMGPLDPHEIPTMGPLDPHGPASGGGGVILVPPRGDAAFLAPLPVALLPLPSEARERVARLGARTLGDFGRLPANALRHRFGPEGVVARALAAGHDEGPLRPRPTPLQLHDAIDLEWVETSMDRLLFLLKRLADRLSVRLGQHGLGCGRLRVSWLLDGAGLTTGDDLPSPARPALTALTSGPSPSGRGEPTLEGCLTNDGAPPFGPPRVKARLRPPAAPAQREREQREGAQGPAGDGTIVSTVRLAEPAGSGASLLEHLRWHVEGLRPETFRDPITGEMRGVRGIVVEAEELAPLSGRQLALLAGEDGRADSSERLLAVERALARLRARWGEGAVRQAELVASRRPERAFRWRETGLASQLSGSEGGTLRPDGARRTSRTPRSSGGDAVFWLLGQPEEIEVTRGGRLPNGRYRPGTIAQGRRVRRIARAAGPWRLVERWAAEPVARDGYHVVLADGTACWLVHDRDDDRWRIVGTFD
jgi:hypothetical protein